jgi:alanine racemase
MKSVLTIDLSAIRKNFLKLQQQTAPAACAVVVKADAYGLGMEQVAKTLWEAGAREFFVAQLDEAVELRKLLPHVAIYVLNGLFHGEEKIFIEGNLVPCLNDGFSLYLWQQAARAGGNPLPCILHVDTGLNRLGFNPSEFRQINTDGLDVLMVMSHLACADQSDHPMNKQQRDLFIECTERFPQASLSLAASDGIFCGTRFHFDVVRPGAALYGLNPRPGMDNPMFQVVRLQAPIIQLRDVEQTGAVGYGASAPVAKGQRLATVALGYADGFLRALGNKASLYFGDQTLPVMGRVSMDLVTVDITDLPQDALKVGQMLDVFNAYQTPDQLARMAGTIDYELFTALGSRFERIYTA